MGLTVTDMFCGAGGQSIAAEAAGARLRLGLNHWQTAITTHNTNFPHADHDCADVSQSDPRRYPSTDILCASPECTHHSAARGKRRPSSQTNLLGGELPDDAADRSRATMWDVPRFAERHGYRLVVVENVVEAAAWSMWRAWLHAMECLGYRHQIVCINSQHAGVPQSRDRLFVVFTRRGDRAPDLALSPRAFCMECSTHVHARQSFKPGRSVGRYRSQYVYYCPRCMAVVEPTAPGAREIIDWSIPAQRIADRDRPLSPKTIARIERALTMLRDRFIAQGGVAAAVDLRGTNAPRDLDVPLSTVAAGGTHHGLLAAAIAPYYGTSTPSPIDAPVPTITTRDRHALVASVDRLVVDDCTFRMLQPAELQAAMAFPAAYVIAGNKREKVAQIGNAVTPPVVQHLLERSIESVFGAGS